MTLLWWWMFFGGFCFLVTRAYAVDSSDLKKAPPKIPYAESQAVWADFQSAEYALVYDFASQRLHSSSKIRLTQGEEGHVLFDLVPTVVTAKLDGADVKVDSIPLPDEGEAKVVQVKSSPGEHVLEITHEISDLVRFEGEGVKSSFWMNDLGPREFLEKYLPSNLEFDQYAMAMSVRFTGTTLAHEIMTNGKVTPVGAMEFRIEFPAFFNSTSIYFHVWPRSTFFKREALFRSTDGRSIPVVVYASDEPTATAGMTRVGEILTELEKDYGPWPHEKVVTYLGSFWGGMEYAGATMTDPMYLGHELFHSYHARGLMPSSGDAGWMDEAIAMWRDNGYKTREEPGYHDVQLSGRSPYSRSTPMAAYEQGCWFMEYLAHRAGSSEQFKGVLRSYFQQLKYTTVSTEQFRGEVGKALAADLTQEFDRYVYARGAPDRPNDRPSGWARENPVHRRLSESELQRAL